MRTCNVKSQIRSAKVPIVKATGLCPSRSYYYMLYCAHSDVYYFQIKPNIPRVKHNPFQNQRSEKHKKDSLYNSYGTSSLPIIRHGSIHQPATLQLCGTDIFCPIAVKMHLQITWYLFFLGKKIEFFFLNEIFCTVLCHNK